MPTFGNLLICTVGLPRSGKSTWARKQGVPVVNPDSIRLACYGQRFWAPGEKRVWSDAHQMVRALFLAGHTTVIVDATHTTRKRRDFWREDWGDPAGLGWELAFRHFDVSPLVCKERAEAMGDGDILPIIDRMAEKWEPLGDDEQQIGASGRFTKAPISDDDEGELNIAVGSENGNVMVRFGKPVGWLGLPPAHAKSLGAAIITRAKAMEP